ncbi:hypothetical protein EBU95_03780 [bacterium]|nr:hypothetical protein [bacterium]
MIVLGLDVSKHTGFAIFGSNGILTSGTFDVDCRKKTNLVNEYNYIEESLILSEFVLKLVQENKIDKIFIEQTNRGINRHSQKELEFLHYGILKRLHENGHQEKVSYVDTSTWRSALAIRLSKDQKKHNKEVKSKKKRGRITTKHLVVNWANTTFNKELILKDNNEADAIAIAFYGFNAIGKAQKVEKTDFSLQEVFNK